VADGAVSVFPGNYEDYLWRKGGGGPAAPARETQRQEEPRKTPAAKMAPAAKSAPAATVKATAVQDDKLRRLNPIKLRQMKERQRAIEDEITRLEVEIADFEQALSNFQSAEMSVEVASLLESRQKDMKNLLAEWEEVSATIEANR
jgi:ATP-binding cassette subfamily F protein 3